jgi:hypothetical protein
MRLQDVKSLHESIVRGWQQWVTDAPDKWKEDGFLTSKYPISVASLYGQDQPLTVDDDAHANALAESFGQDNNYGKLRVFSFALASHIE